MSSELPNWKKPVRCDNGNCAEVAHLGTGIGIRDSTMPDVALEFPKRDWNQFMRAMRAGEFVGPAAMAAEAQALLPA
jgi:hypothetical protein